MAISGSGKKFYDEQIAYLLAMDVDTLIDNHYTENATLVSFDTTVRGRAALKEHFRNYLQMLGDLQVKSTDKFTETGDTLFFEATVETGNFGVVRVYDAFVLEDGKASYHFTGVKDAPPEDDNVPDTPLGRMYKEHIQFILDKNIDALLDQYTDDTLLISSFQKEPLYYKGREELREHMQGIEGLETKIVFWAETENPQTLMITEEIKMKTPEGEANMRFADSWVLRDGKIAIHFAGMVQYPDGSLARIVSATSSQQVPSRVQNKEEMLPVQLGRRLGFL